MKTNKKATDRRLSESERLAGGMGGFAATQNAEALLRRSVMACLLWENIAYASGSSVASEIARLVPLVEPSTVAGIALEARTEQKLRHVPLLIAAEMTKYSAHNRFVRELLPKIILRPDEMTEFLSLYWADGKHPIANSVRKGLAESFVKFNAYSLKKYDRGTRIKLRDVMFMIRPKPRTRAQEEAFRQLANGQLPKIDTWETASSLSVPMKAEWERLLKEGKMGALAFMRNLRNMEKSGVDDGLIRDGFANISPEWLLPLNYLAAAKAAPRYEREIESLMMRGFDRAGRMKGHTVIVVDVSGSMNSRISQESEFSRMDACAAMAMLAAEMSERVSVYITAGSDYSGQHETVMLPPRRGFGLISEILSGRSKVGVGGIFTRQAIDYIRTRESGEPDRIIVLSDSQDCDNFKKLPSPFGKANYIVDVSSHSRGINYAGVWTAEISGWSEHFVKYIMSIEGISTGSGSTNG